MFAQDFPPVCLFIILLSLPAPALSHQPEDLQVQPDQRHGQGEGVKFPLPERRDFMPGLPCSLDYTFHKSVLSKLSIKNPLIKKDQVRESALSLGLRCGFGCFNTRKVKTSSKR